MSATNPTPATVEMSDHDAFEYAQKIAHERFLPIQAQIYAEYSALSKRGSNVDAATRLVGMQEAMQAAYDLVFSQAVMEVQILRKPDLITRILAAADVRAEAHVAALYPAPGDAPAPTTPASDVKH